MLSFFILLTFVLDLYELLLNFPNHTKMQPVTKNSSQPRRSAEQITNNLQSYKCGWLYKRGMYK